MKNLMLLILMLRVLSVKCDDFQSQLGHIKPQMSAEAQENATIQLIKRILPERHKEFIVKILNNLSPTGKDTFQVKKIENIIEISGTTGVAAATGFNYYLKYFCFCHISWEVSQLNLPAILPDVNITITLNDRYRYYQNVCTSGYSFLWWDWKQWEKHIDWIVLNSFNLVLAFNGQEAIWERVYQKFNLTQSEINEHFSGPAFLPWLRMGNIRGWAGPLFQSWHDRSLYLQKLILDRMRSFGIITVLPAFAGYVPRGFKRLYPNTKMTKLEVWNSFNDTYCCPYFLDPNEELFRTIGILYLKEQEAEFGTDHMYNCDSFNEVDPSTSDPDYLTKVGNSIYNSMIEVDSKAIWVMQGWLFYHNFFFWTRERAKALLTSVPLGKMIVLDLQSEQFPQYDRLEQYFGQPYIWCMLHNFGGTLGMFGSVDIINENPIIARNAENSTMIGIGLTPEGINQNYVVYDLMIESAWKSEPVDLTDWFRNYTVRRYGKFDNYAYEAWKILGNTVYNFKGIERMRGKYAITRAPSLNIQTWIWYETSKLLEAWENMIKASDSLSDSKAFLHDLVDVTRQVLQVNGDHYYNELIKAYKSKNLNLFRNISQIYLDTFSDLELILATNEAFLLGKWLNSAKDCGTNELEIHDYEYNARNQLTLWGPNGQILDYANKQWAGLISNYYGPRWLTFIEYMDEVLTNKRKFNTKYIRNKIFSKVEEPFTFDRSEFPVIPIGDTIKIAKDIYNKIWWKTSLKSGMLNGRTVNFELDDLPEYVSVYDKRHILKEEPRVIILK